MSERVERLETKRVLSRLQDGLVWPLDQGIVSTHALLEWLLVQGLLCKVENTICKSTEEPIRMLVLLEHDESQPTQYIV